MATPAKTGTVESCLLLWVIHLNVTSQEYVLLMPNEFIKIIPIIVIGVGKQSAGPGSQQGEMQL